MKPFIVLAVITQVMLGHLALANMEGGSTSFCSRDLDGFLRCHSTSASESGGGGGADPFHGARGGRGIDRGAVQCRNDCIQGKTMMCKKQFPDASAKLRKCCVSACAG